MNRGNRKRSYDNSRFRGMMKKSSATRDRPSSKCAVDPGKRLSESSLGISEYVSDLPGFSGIIKARFSDFHVNEIDESGAVAILTDDKVPPTPQNNTQFDNSDIVNEANNPHGYNTSILPLATWQEIEEIVKLNTKQIVKFDATSVSKEDRTRIYNVVKERFGNAVVGSTLNESDKKYITFTKYDKGVRRDNRVKWLWPGEWVHFLVHKVNIDTMQAATELANGLQMKPGNITYAGTKDRRGKTTQWFCIKKMQPERIIKATKFARNIVVGNFTFKNTSLKLGQLKGNRFRIVLRNVNGDNEIINKALHSLKSKGFINYYGLQRFGSCAEVPTYLIGLALIKSNWKEAVELILKPRSDESNYQMRLARQEWWETRNPSSALDKLFRNNSSVEYKLLCGLSKCKENDYVTALENVPRNMRLLYLHSYQSFIWNKMVSRRIREEGLKLLEGDLVFVDDVKNTEEPIDDLILLEETEENEHKDIVKDDALQGSENNVASTDKDKKPKVRALTCDDLNSGKFSIFDIVLPLPGFDVIYPSNKIVDWYKEILAEDGLTLDSWKNRVKTYALSGSYRKILTKPENMNWEVTFYNDPNENLILSDVEILKGEKLEKKAEGKYKALILDFCLCSSTYATMALREVLKGDTSSESQAKLNSYHEDARPDDLRNVEDNGCSAESTSEQDTDKSEAKKLKSD